MGFVSGIVVYLLTWWLVIFMVLPWGIERDETGKPVNPKLKKKIIITSIISAVLWLVIYALIEANIMNFREIAGSMKIT